MRRILVTALALSALAAPAMAASTSKVSLAKSGPAASASTPAAACKPVNVNTATLRDLDAIPQIGDVRAKQIVAGRPYASVDAVAKVVPQAYPTIKNCLKVETVNVNTASAAELTDKLPGVGTKGAAKIVANRPYRSVSDLGKALTPAQIKADTPLVTFN